MAEAQPDAPDGSAEYVAELLGTRGLGCSHYAAKKSKDKSAFPSRLGFFHKTAPDTRISYLDTKSLCLDCLYLAVPNGFNFWSLLVDASPGAPDVSKLDAPPSMDMYPPLLKCGTEGFSSGPRSAVEPVVIPIPDVPRAKEAWLWLQEERKPFYIDQLHLTTRRLLPLAKRAVQADAMTVLNYGLSFDKRQIMKSAPQVSSPRPTRSTPPTSIIRRKAVGSGASKTRSRIGSNRSLTPQSVAPSVDMERQSTNGSQTVSDADLSILSQATTATSFTDVVETAPKVHGPDDDSVIEATSLPETNQHDSSPKESKSKIQSKEIKSSSKRKEKKESSKKVKPSPTVLSEATEAIVSVDALPRAGSNTVGKDQGLVAVAINPVAIVEEPPKTNGKLEKKPQTPSLATNGSTSAIITHSTIFPESTSIKVKDETLVPKDTTPPATKVPKPNGRVEAATMNGSAQENSHDLSIKLAETSTKITESTETGCKPKEKKKKKKKDSAETKAAEPSSTTAGLGTSIETIKPDKAEGDLNVKKDSSTKTKTSASTSTNGTTPPQTNVPPVPKQDNPSPVNMLGIMEQGALIKHNPPPQPTTMVHFTSTNSSLPTPNGAVNSAPKSLMLSARLLRQKPPSKSLKASDRPHYTRNWSQYKQIEFESKVLVSSSNSGNLHTAASGSKKHRSKKVADDSDLDEPTTKKGSKVKDKSTKEAKTEGEASIKSASGTKEKSPSKQRLSTKDKSETVKADGLHSGSTISPSTHGGARSTKSTKLAKLDKPQNHNSGSSKLASGHADQTATSKPHGSKSGGSGGSSKGGGFKLGFEHSSNKSKSKNQSKSEHKPKDSRSSHRHDTDDSDHGAKKKKNDEKKPDEKQENKKEEEKVKPEGKKPEGKDEEAAKPDEVSPDNANNEQSQKPETEKPGPTDPTPGAEDASTVNGIQSEPSDSEPTNTDLSSPSTNINATSVVEEPESPPPTDPAQEKTKPANSFNSNPAGPSLSAEIDVTVGSPEAGNTTKPDAIQQDPSPPNGSISDNKPPSSSVEDTSQSKPSAPEGAATPNAIPEESKAVRSSTNPSTRDVPPVPSNAMESELGQQDTSPPGPSATDKQVPSPSGAGGAKDTPPTAENTAKQEPARGRSSSPSTTAQQPPSFSVDVNATVNPRGRDSTPKPVATPGEQEPSTSTRGYPAAVNPPVTSRDAGPTESSRAGTSTSADSVQDHPSASQFQPSININGFGVPETGTHEEAPSSRDSSHSRSSNSISNNSRDVSPIGRGAYDGNDSDSESGSSSRNSSPTRNFGPDENVSDDTDSVKDDAYPIGNASQASSRSSSVSSQWSSGDHDHGALGNEASHDENGTDHDHASVNGDGSSSDSESDKNGRSDDDDHDTDKDGNSSDDSDSDQENDSKDSSSDQEDNGDEGGSSSDSDDSGQEDGESEGEDSNNGDSSDQDNDEDGSSNDGGDSSPSDSESNDGDGEDSDAGYDSDQNDSGSERSDDDQDDRSDSDEESEGNYQGSDQQSDFYRDQSEKMLPPSFDINRLWCRELKLKRHVTQLGAFFFTAQPDFLGDLLNTPTHRARCINFIVDAWRLTIVQLTHRWKAIKKSTLLNGDVKNVAESLGTVHHESFVALDASAAAGCYLCRILRAQVVHHQYNALPAWVAENIETGRCSLKLETRTFSGSMEIAICFYVGEYLIMILAHRASTRAIETKGMVGAQIKRFAPHMLHRDLESLIQGPIHTWIDDCIHRRGAHSQCDTRKLKQDGDSYPPTRVIDVGVEPSPTIRVVVPKEDLTEPDKLQYLALSYCWGAANEPAKTTRSTIDTRRRGFPLNGLPKTIQDAVKLTRLLGFRYLWVDAICIIQSHAGDRYLDDWNREALRMGSYYSNAYCLISASSASNSSEGLFMERKAQKYSMKPCLLAFDKDKGETLYLPVPEPDLHQELADQPLLKRGWCLQERLLSIRALHWSKNCLYWQCQGIITASELFPLDKLREPIVDVQWSVHHLLKDSAEVAMGKSWNRVVEDYKGMSLTFETDRLVAIQGLADRLVTLHGGQYFAGAFQSHLANGLLWRINGACTEEDILSHYPSWSWASRKAHFGISFQPISNSLLRCTKPDVFPPKRNALDFGDPLKRVIRFEAPLVSLELGPHTAVRGGHHRMTWKDLEQEVAILLIFDASELTPKPLGRILALFLDLEDKPLPSGGRITLRGIIIQSKDQFHERIGLVEVRERGRFQPVAKWWAEMDKHRRDVCLV
ncbi:hypothetical protein NM208_g4244 [Fusarium decemcellulare]|uniref:Uncharacterized protein n=1 Tax=Fusarium decemcellulare TaxID=57161 RepID=A0ACC1SLD0_9HYPO|nr:hypothetical protein NM208_g4244 [Fusarium decemcellulare]